MNPILVIHLNRAGGRTIRDWLAGHFEDYVVIDDAASKRTRRTQGKTDKQVLANIIDLRTDQAIDAWHDQLQYKYLAEPTEPLVFTVVRDPVNLWPSRSLSPRHVLTKTGRDVADAWVSHVSFGPNLILYDYWFMQHQLYFGKLRSLGIEPWRPRQPSLPKQGPGSPFDKDWFQGRAEKMDTLRRYLGFENRLRRWLPKSVVLLADQWFPYRERTETLIYNPTPSDPELREDSCLASAR